MLCLPLVIPTVFAEPIALQMASTFGYLSAKVFVGFMYIAGGLCLFALRSWKLCDMEKMEMESRNENTPHQSLPDDKRWWLTPRRLFTNKRI